MRSSARWTALLVVALAGCRELPKQGFASGRGAVTTCPPVNACNLGAVEVSPPAPEVGDEVVLKPVLECPSELVRYEVGTPVPTVGWASDTDEDGALRLTASLPGSYEVTAFDDLTPECDGLSVQIDVAPDAPLWVDLTWTTPAGQADLDLHLLHPFAEGVDVNDDGEADGWFDAVWDVFWYNADGGWGVRWTAASGHAGGPEVVRGELTMDAAFDVGVHFFADYGSQQAFPRLRVFMDGELALDRSGVWLVSGDLWRPARIWPAIGAIIALDTDTTPSIYRDVDASGL